MKRFVDYKVVKNRPLETVDGSDSPSFSDEDGWSLGTSDIDSDEKKEEEEKESPKSKKSDLSDLEIKS